MCRRAVVSLGDENYLGAVFGQVKACGKLKIAFLGGSITQGCHATAENRRFASLLAEKLGGLLGAEVEMLNAGIGATDSLFGCARARRQVLPFEPDVVVVDFTVNDACGEIYKESFESLVRLLLSDANVKAVVVLENCFFDGRENARRLHSEVAAHYGLPVVDTALFFDQAMESGEHTACELSTDLLHPTDLGHGYIAQMLCELFAAAKERFESDEKSFEKPCLPAPLTACGFENGVMFDCTNCEPELSGFAADGRVGLPLSDAFQKGWTGARCGDSITFEFKAKKLFVQWRRTVSRPAPYAEVLVDGEKVAELDGAFEENWGDFSCMTLVFEADSAKAHSVTVKVVQACEAVPFMVMSFITFG